MSGRGLCFGPFKIDPKTGELRNQGKIVKLAQKPREALLLLLERAGDIVTREELRRRLWPADTFVEFDDNLNATIKRLRETLDDSALQPRFIETIPKRGYKFTAPVQNILAPISSSDPNPITARPPGAVTRAAPGRLRSPTMRMVLGSALSLLLLLFGVMLSRALRKVNGIAGATVRPAVLAVMPIANLTGNPDQQFVADGLTEDLIAKLGRLSVRDLSVIARTSVTRAASEETTQHDSVEQLGADYVLRGALRRREAGFVLDTHFIRARDQHELWGETFQIPLQETFLGLLVSRRVTEVLGIRPHIKDRTELSRSETSDLAAYQAYLHGVYALHEENRAALLSALNFFNDSVRNDPQFAMPLAGRARAYLLLSAIGAMPRTQAEHMAKADIDAGIKLDSSVVDFFVLDGEILANEGGLRADIEADYRRALIVNPNDTEALEQYALFLRELRPGEALSYIERARHLDPLSARVTAISGWVLISAGRLDDADLRLQSALRLDPQSSLAFLFLGNLENHRGHPTEAITWFEKATAASGRQPRYLYRLAREYAELGRGDDVRRILAELRDQSRLRRVEPAYIHSLEAMLGS